MTELSSGTREALRAYALAGSQIEPLGSGLINATWLVSVPQGDPVVLQRVNGVFPPEINNDIAVVTEHLARQGLRTPRLLPTSNGELWLENSDGVWRLLTFVPGLTRNALDDAVQAAAAGRLLARFHRGLDGLEHAFANRRLGVHDTARHLMNLRQAVATHRQHAQRAVIEPLADEILQLANELPPIPQTPDRIVHGDPKINNMLFDAATGEGVALVDLDTVGRMPLPLELGDAFRSWCNPMGEDGRTGVFSVTLFMAALEAYLREAAGWITPKEVDAVLPATATIIVELAARFCADALNESYFGWDPQRFASRSEHNQVRAAGQLALARSLLGQRAELEEIVVEQALV